MGKAMYDKLFLTFSEIKFGKDILIYFLCFLGSRDNFKRYFKFSSLRREA